MFQIFWNFNGFPNKRFALLQIVIYACSSNAKTSLGWNYWIDALFWQNEINDALIPQKFDKADLFFYVSSFGSVGVTQPSEICLLIVRLNLFNLKSCVRLKLFGQFRIRPWQTNPHFAN